MATTDREDPELDAQLKKMEAGAPETLPQTGNVPGNSDIPPTEHNGRESPLSETSVGHEERTGQPLEKSKSAQSQGEKLGKNKIVVIMLALCIALFLAALDMTITATALPTIAEHFHATESGYTWIGSAYLLAASASVPLWGKLSDIWGRKPIIVIANATFLVGSLICALSVDIGMLIVGRALQGMGGGGLIILVNIVISDLFSMRTRATYFGIVGMVWAIAGGIGPVIGGAFTSKVSWRWCFYINLPLDGVSLVILILFLKIDTPKTPFWAGVQAIDWVGVITIVGGVVMFLFGLEAGGISHPWDSAYSLCLIIFGLVTVGLFFVNEWKFAKYPIMPIRLFKSRSNCAALLTSFCHGFTFIAGSYFLPLYFQTVLGANALLSGVYLLAYVLALSFISAAVGITIRKTGRYLEPIRLGMAVMTLGFGLFIALPDHASWARIIIFQIIAGIGVGPNFQAPLIAIQTTVKPSDIATATGTFGFIRQLSTSISVVLGGVIFQNEMAKHASMLRSAFPASEASQITASSSGSNTAFLRTLHGHQKQVIDQAYSESLQKMWIFYTCIAGFGACASWFIGKRVLSESHEKAKTGLAAQEEARQEREDEARAKREGNGVLNGEKGKQEV